MGVTAKYKWKSKLLMEFHALDLISTSKLLHTINALDLPPFSSLSYRGHQEGFMSTPLQCGSVSLSWGFPGFCSEEHSEALQPLQVTLYPPL